MNAESPVDHPAPVHHEMSPTEVVIFIALMLLGLFAIHLFLHFRNVLKGKPVTDTSDSQDKAAPNPQENADVGPLVRTLQQQQVKRAAHEQGAYEVGMTAAPPEFSVNDVHLLREQDQALAQLTAQYEGMFKSPWKYDSQQVRDLGDKDMSTNVRLQSYVLSAMMMPISAAASQRGTSARQTMWFMNVGVNKVTAESEAKCKAIHQRLNDEYFRIIGDHRKATLGRIAAALGLVDREATMHAAQCGQTRVSFTTREEAEAMSETLNASYMEIVRPELERVMKEIRDEAGR